MGLRRKCRLHTPLPLPVSVSSIGVLNWCGQLVCSIGVPAYNIKKANYSRIPHCRHCIALHCTASNIDGYFWHHTVRLDLGNKTIGGRHMDNGQMDGMDGPP